MCWEVANDCFTVLWRWRFFFYSGRQKTSAPFRTDLSDWAVMYGEGNHGHVCSPCFGVLRKTDRHKISSFVIHHLWQEVIMPRTYDEELKFIERINSHSWRIKKGFVPNMNVSFQNDKPFAVDERRSMLLLGRRNLLREQSFGKTDVWGVGDVHEVRWYRWISSRYETDR